jgi:hypothetical protein
VTLARFERWSKLAAAHLKDVSNIDLRARQLVMFLDNELHDREDPECGKWRDLWELEVNGRKVPKKRPKRISGEKWPRGPRS